MKIENIRVGHPVTAICNCEGDNNKGRIMTANHDYEVLSISDEYIILDGDFQVKVPIPIKHLGLLIKEYVPSNIQHITAIMPDGQRIRFDAVSSFSNSFPEDHQ